MKILLTGRNGQLGFELARALSPLGEIVSVGRSECDLTDANAIRSMIRGIRPGVIVNPAAFTAVDKAESDAMTAQATNAMAPGIIGEEAAKLGAFVIHYSTDYVFDGNKTTPYAENDLAAPGNVYGSTKLAGEQALKASGADNVILRTSWVAGVHGRNFAKTMLRLATDRDNIKVVCDQVGAPTTADLLADITAHLVRQHARETGGGLPTGIYHVAAEGDTDWCSYARFLITEALALGASLRTKPEHIMPITTAEYPTPARRPANSRLDTNCFRKTFGFRLPPWQEGIRRVLTTILRDSQT